MDRARRPGGLPRVPSRPSDDDPAATRADAGHRDATEVVPLDGDEGADLRRGCLERGDRPAEVPEALLADGREQPHGHGALPEQGRGRGQRRHADRVVADAGTVERTVVCPHRVRHLRCEDRIQVRAQQQGRSVAAASASPDVADGVEPRRLPWPSASHQERTSSARSPSPPVGAGTSESSIVRRTTASTSAATSSLMRSRLPRRRARRSRRRRPRPPRARPGCPRPGWEPARGR